MPARTVVASLNCKPPELRYKYCPVDGPNVIVALELILPFTKLPERRYIMPSE